MSGTSVLAPQSLRHHQNVNGRSRSHDRSAQKIPKSLIDRVITESYHKVSLQLFSAHGAWETPELKLPEAMRQVNALSMRDGLVLVQSTAESEGSKRSTLWALELVGQGAED